MTTQALTRTTRTETTAEYGYDYAGQDPINNYDLDGRSCKWAGIFGHLGKKACHKIASPAVTIRDEFTADVNAADASVASAAMGGPPVAPNGPISGPAKSGSPLAGGAVHAASCVAGGVGLVWWVTAGTAELGEVFGAKSSSQLAKGIIGSYVGKRATWGSVLVGISGATGACGLWK